MQICEILFLNFQTKDMLTKCPVNGLQTVITVKRALLDSLVVSEMEGRKENDLYDVIALSTCRGRKHELIPDRSKSS